MSALSPFAIYGDVETCANRTHRISLSLCTRFVLDIHIGNVLVLVLEILGLGGIQNSCEGWDISKEWIECYVLRSNGADNWRLEGQVVGGASMLGWRTWKSIIVMYGSIRKFTWILLAMAIDGLGCVLPTNNMPLHAIRVFHGYFGDLGFCVGMSVVWWCMLCRWWCGLHWQK